jgi:hypothetical protein
MPSSEEIERSNGGLARVDGHVIHLELTFAEADAVRSWLLKPAADGRSALDEELVKASLVKLAHALDYVWAVASLREELENAGLPVERLSDEQVADLGRRLSKASSQLRTALPDDASQPAAS